MYLYCISICIYIYMTYRCIHMYVPHSNRLFAASCAASNPSIFAGRAATEDGAGDAIRKARHAAMGRLLWYIMYHYKHT